MNILRDILDNGQIPDPWEPAEKRLEFIWLLATKLDDMLQGDEQPSMKAIRSAVLTIRYAAEPEEDKPCGVNQTGLDANDVPIWKSL